MKGLLVYDPDGAKRNAEFIEKLTASAKACGIELKLCLYDANFSIDKDIDFAAVRTVAPALNAELEKRGIRVFNNSETSKIANDKWLTYSMCRKLDIPTVPTYDKIPDEPLLPCVEPQRARRHGSLSNDDFRGLDPNMQRSDRRRQNLYRAKTRDSEQRYAIVYARRRSRCKRIANEQRRFSQQFFARRQVRSMPAYRRTSRHSKTRLRATPLRLRRDRFYPVQRRLGIERDRGRGRRAHAVQTHGH